MAIYTKPEARRHVQDRITNLTNDKYIMFCREVYAQVALWLDTAPYIKSALLYHAQPKWREVAVSDLEDQFSSITFEYVEPQKNAHFPSWKYDIVFVPLYGFSAQGYRLGHGGGWYDRLLALQPQATKVGIGLAMNEIDFSVEPHDIRMDVCITERGIQVLESPGAILGT